MDSTTKEALITRARENGKFAARFASYQSVRESFNTALVWFPFKLTRELMDRILQEFNTSYEEETRNEQATK